MMNFYLTPVVKNLIILNVAMWVITVIIVPDVFYNLCIYYPETENFRPLQIASYMFMHDNGSINHLLFNMLFLVMAGSRVESIWGAQKFLFYYLFSGVAALILFFGMVYYKIHFQGVPVETYEMQPLLGASGAVYGVIAAFGYLFAEEQIQLFFPPIIIKIKYLAFMMIFGQLINGINGPQTGVAHLAHASGAIFGLLLIFYWNKGGKIGEF